MRRRVSTLAIVALLLMCSLAVVGSIAAQSSGQAYYTVVRGDSLARIAARFGVTVQAITQANGIANPNLIYSGQVLLIPSPVVVPTPVPPVPAPGGSYYTVRTGDTLRLIAGWYGTTIQAIVQANGIFNPNRIYPGQVLYIPPVTYTRIAAYYVVYGDTLARIARRYGSSVAAIVQYNGLPNPNHIFAGQLLYIPY